MQNELFGSSEDGEKSTTADNSLRDSEIEEVQSMKSTPDVDEDMISTDHQSEESKTLEKPEIINQQNMDENTDSCQISDTVREEQFNPKRTALSKANCTVCKGENSEAVNVCITCKERLCFVCSENHGLEASKHTHQIVSIKQVLEERFPCIFCKRNASQHCHTCNSDFCDKCRFNHQPDRQYEHTMIDIITHAITLTSRQKPVCGTCNRADEMQSNRNCKTCDPLISLCEHFFEQHKTEFTNHGTSTQSPKIDETKSNLYKKGSKCVSCIPCQYDDIDKNATSFCQSCTEPEPMCAECAAQHIRERRTRDHEICNDIQKLLSTDKLKDEIVCENCSFGGIVSTAVGFCMTCEEQDPLCEKCAKFHLKQRSFRTHKISYDLGILNKKILCEPCSIDDKSIPATHFCVDCEEPEPMCQSCADMHLKQRSGRGHKLCEDFGKFSKSEVKSDKKDDNQHKIFCCPCSYDKLENLATHFCKTCKDPEPLCQMCAQQHLRQRSGRGHSLCEDLREFTNQQKIALLSQEKEEKPKKSDDKSPGKPNALNIKSDSIQLAWEKAPEKVDHYQIRYKNKDGKEKWKFVYTDSNENCVTIPGLMANTSYIFQVRGIIDDQEGCYGPVNNDLKTLESSATTLLGFCELKEKGSPSKYQLPVEENKRARNKSARTRQLILGRQMPHNTDEKTIMLVGATGSGKSTLVDGIVNYVMGVSFEDPFRFTLVTLEDEEKKTHNQAVSQTEWITVYKIAPQKGSRLKYTLNIIDTPGFGDTRGIERDNAVVDQIRHLFSAQDEQGVLYIDAVCFIVKAPDARLTVVQKYIFHSIMSLFGKDIESNICTLITFADGAKPPVLASLNESKLPFGKTFQFNNSALFSENKSLVSNTLSPMFWEMGCCSFEQFFDKLNDFQTRSLRQTKSVLEEREQLKTVISNIRPQVTAGLSKLAELREQVDIFTRHKNEIKDNENFTYQVDETKQNKVDLPAGKHVTNCLQCNVTCHEDCKIADDDKKSGCWAMDQSGHCRICSGKCIWSEHKNTPYIFTYVTETVTKTYSEMKARYEEAMGQTLTHEKYIEELTYDVDEMFEEIGSMMNQMNICKTRLKEIALRPDPLSAVEHIELMIQSEESEKRNGYQRRISMLMEMKRMALVVQDVEDFGRNVKDAHANFKIVTGKSFHRSMPKRRVSIVKKGNPLTRGYQYLKKWF